MADLPLRELERQWKATADPVIGLHLILAMFRVGLPVDLDSFPLELWQRISADFPIENIAHHLAIGGERLDRQFSFWHRFTTDLPRVGTGYPNLVNNDFDLSNLNIIAMAAARQKCRSSIVYYPTLSDDKRIAMYLTLILSPRTLSEHGLQQMRDDGRPGASPYEDTTHWGLAMKAFFNPHGSPRPQQLSMVALIDASPVEANPDSWVTMVLDNVAETYSIPIDPPKNNPGYRVPFLVLKELGYH